MKAFIKDNRILLLIIAVALITAIVIIGGRAGVERDNKTYDVVLDYTELEELARQSDHDITWWLGQFKAMGITKVGLLEENFLTLEENETTKVSAEVMSIIMKDADWEQKYPQTLVQQLRDHHFDQYDVLVKASTLQDYEFVLNAVKARYPAKKYYYEGAENGGYIVFDATPKDTLFKEKYKLVNSMKKGFVEISDIQSSKIKYLNVGLLPSKVKVLQDAGMDIIPRTASYEGWNSTKYAKAVVSEYETMGIDFPYMIVGGEALIGQDDGIAAAQKYIKENDITIGLIENTTQLQNILQFGVEEVVKQDDYNAVRIFSVWDYIQNRYKYYGYQGAEEIENTLFRAITERNVRVIYFKPIKEYKDQRIFVTDEDVYKSMFENLEKRLDKHNLEFGQASVMKDYHVPVWAKVIMALGCVAAAIMLLRTFLTLRRKAAIALGVLGALGVAGIAAVAPHYLELLGSFGAAVIFPCLAVALITGSSKSCSHILRKDEKLTRIIPIAVGTLLLGIIIALIGGVMTAAPLSSVNYMLEIDIFRGVKAAQLLPIAFFIVAYVAYFGFGERKKMSSRLEYMDIKEIMNTNIKVWMLLLGAVILAVGVYYIDRTGHESSVQVSNLEMIFRNTLEDHLLARPRSKEFLFAFPAAMLMIYTAVRRFKLWPILFGLASVIGMTSVNNTFMHIRTPLYLGFVRTGYSALFGILIGIVAIIVFELLYKLYKKIERQIGLDV